MAGKIPHYDLHDAVRALEENLVLLSPKEHRVARNLSTALHEMALSMMRIESDLEYLNGKIGPLLKEIAEDYDIAREETRGKR